MMLKLGNYKRPPAAAGLYRPVHVARLLQHPHRCHRSGISMQPGKQSIMHLATASKNGSQAGSNSGNEAASSQRIAIAPWRKQAAAVLEQAREQNVNQAFAVAGELADMPAKAVTALQVTGLPDIMQLPLAPHQVDKLLALGQPAPFGLNANTILDPTVRKALQIDAACVTASTVWQNLLKRITSQVAAELGVDPHVTVEARPYKLLMYTEGGHFKAHKDTEKEAGMFGTLVVQLPVLGGHEGGDLVFSHHGITRQWDTASSSKEVSFQYAAFYADVEHELQPITSGTRVVMVYNLVRPGGDPIPAPQDGCPLLKKLRGAITCWEQDLDKHKDNTPRFLCVLLSHQYTYSSLSFSALKGADARVVGCLNHPNVGLDVHLAQLHRIGMYTDGSITPERYQGTEYSVLGCVSSVGTTPCDSILYHLGLLRSGQYSVALKPKLLGGGVVPVWDVEGDGEEGEEDDEAEECEEGEEKEEQEEREWEEGKEEEVEVGWEGAVEYVEDGVRKRRRTYEILRQPYMGNEGGTYDKIYHDTVAIIWPKARAESLLGYGLESLLYQLEWRKAQNDAARVAALEQEMVDRFKTGRWYGSEAITVLQAVMKLNASKAVPTLAQIIANLSDVGDVNNDWRHYDIEKDTMELPDMDQYGDACPYIKGGDELRYAIVDSIIIHGTTPELVTAATTLVTSHAVKCTTACVRLALRAASKSTVLGSALADAILLQTLLAQDAKCVFGNMKHYDICNLAVMLAKLPAYNHHMQAFATKVLELPDPQPVFELLVKAPAINSSADRVSGPLRILTQARQQHLQQFLKPEPVFTWEMKEASLPEHPDVEAFLRGPDVKATFSYFKDQLETHNLVSKHFCNTQWYEVPSLRRPKQPPTYTAKAEAIYEGGKDSVVITKTRALYDHQLKVHLAEQKPIKDALAQAEKLLQLCEVALNTAASKP